MSNPSRYLADGFYAGVHWFAERPADMVAPAVLVTLQTWHGPGLTYASETHECLTMDRGGLVRLIDDLLQRLEALGAKHVRQLKSSQIPPGA